jgi:anti-sigma regulatory factor (Ser/Thr protein kinase)
MPGEATHLEKKFAAKLEALGPVLAWMRECAPLSGFKDEEWKRIEVALEEALVNIIQHAYSKKQGTIILSCDMVPKEKIEFLIRDSGCAFNPENIPDPSSDEEIEDRKEGGLGLVLMHAYMDEIRYERIGKQNVLRLVKYC